MRNTRRKVYVVREGKRRRMLRSRKVMEEFLGRRLSSKEIVHHKDGNWDNDDPENLEVMTQAQHAKLHLTQNGGAVRKRLPAPNKARCCKCGKKFKMDSIRRGKWRRGQRRFFCSLDCYRRR